MLSGRAWAQIMGHYGRNADSQAANAFLINRYRPHHPSELRSPPAWSPIDPSHPPGKSVIAIHVDDWPPEAFRFQRCAAALPAIAVDD